MDGFDLGYQDYAQRAAQQRNIAEQQRVQNQNKTGALLLDSINNASNIKPPTDPQTIVDETTGKTVPNPVYLSKQKAYDDAQQAKADLHAQYVQLMSPAEHASFGQRLHGLIFGTPTEHAQQPALSTNSKPVAPMADPNQPAPPTPPPDPNAPGGGVDHPLAPASSDHPLHAITAGISALGNHLKSFANPLPPQPNPVNSAEAAKYYADPSEVAFERNKELWGVRGQNALDLQDKKNEYLKAMLAARPPRLLSQTTIPDLLEQMKVDPTMNIYGPNGNELTPAQLAEMPPGTIAREFRAGSQIFYALGDQNSKTLKVGNVVYDIPSIGGINAGNSTALGVANVGSSTTDPFGTTTTTRPAVGGITAPAPSGPVAPGTTPTLQPRSANAPTVPSIVPTNPGARLPGTQPIGGAVKPKPISANAPSTPSSAPATLDADGHIPPGVGNDLVRQYANNLLDGQDSKDIPNPRARAAAEAMASQYGWGRGAFTPKEKIQFQVATDFLHQLQDSPALSVLDNFVSREKIARAMKDPKQMDMLDRIAAYNLNPQEAEFLRLFNAARGTVAGLSTITRSGRATNSQVTTIANELPNVFQSSSSKDAKDRVGQLLKEADIALNTNPMNVGKKGPVSKNAPGAPNPPLVDRLNDALGH